MIYLFINVNYIYMIHILITLPVHSLLSSLPLTYFWSKPLPCKSEIESLHASQAHGPSRPALVQTSTASGLSRLFSGPDQTPRSPHIFTQPVFDSLWSFFILLMHPFLTNIFNQEKLKHHLSDTTCLSDATSHHTRPMAQAHKALHSPNKYLLST